MPFIDDPNEEEDLDSSVNKPLIAEGESAFAGDSAGGAGAATSPAGPAPTSSGNFTNLQDYLSGNQAGEKTMADNLSTDINSKTAAARGSNLQYINTANNVISSAPTGSDYNGPADYSHLTGDALDAQTKARADTKTASDNLDQVTGGFDKLGSYLKGQAKDPNYTSGENGLDSFLVGASDAGRNAISGVKNVRNDASKYSDAADDAVTSAIDARKALPTAAPAASADAIADTFVPDTILSPPTNNGAPTTRTLPAGVPNSIPGWVDNFPSNSSADSSPAPTYGSAGAKAIGSPNQISKPGSLALYAHGGLIEPEEKTPYSGLLSKLRKK